MDLTIGDSSAVMPQLNQQADVSARIQPVHTLKRDLLFLPCNQIEGRIGEIECAIRSHDHIVRAVEALSIVVIREHLIFPVRSYLGDGSQDARTIDQTMFAIKGVLPSGSPNEIMSSFWPFAYTRILFIVSSLDVEKPRWIPHRPFGEAESCRDGFQFRVAIDEFQELGRGAQA